CARVLRYSGYNDYGLDSW
nr:immunoglobulin heavy chain junction region [Macaca mulatta]